MHLASSCGTVKNQETAIYNFHVPPYGYSLDLCPKLDENLTMSAEEKIHAGSHRRQAGHREVPAAARPARPHPRVARRPEGRPHAASSTPAASTPRASSRASSSCSTRRRSRTTSSPPGEPRVDSGPSSRRRSRKGAIDRRWAQFILPKDIPLDQYPKPEVFLERGQAHRRSGAAGGHRHARHGSARAALLLPGPDRPVREARAAGRPLLHRHRLRRLRQDQRQACAKFMETLGYECDLQTMAMTGKTRHIYYGGKVPMIDVFFDKLDYCHEVNYDGPPRARPLERVARRHHAAEAADLGDQRQGPQGHRVPVHRRRDRRRRRRRRSTRATSPGASPTTGASGTRRPPTSTASRSTSTGADALSADAEAPGIKQRGRRGPGAHRREPKTKKLEQARQEGHQEDLVQHRLLRLVIAAARTCGPEGDARRGGEGGGDQSPRPRRPRRRAPLAPRGVSGRPAGRRSCSLRTSASDRRPGARAPRPAARR